MNNDQTLSWTYPFVALRPQREAPETDIASTEGTFPAKGTGYCPVGTGGDLRLVSGNYQRSECSDTRLCNYTGARDEERRREERKM